MDNEDKPTKKKRAGFSSTKEGGYMSQKRYKENHPDRIKEQRRKQKEKMRGVIYERKLRLPVSSKAALDELLQSTGLSITELCLTAIEEKYGVDLRKPIDK